MQKHRTICTSVRTHRSTHMHALSLSVWMWGKKKCAAETECECNLCIIVFIHCGSTADLVPHSHSSNGPLKEPQKHTHKCTQSACHKYALSCQRYYCPLVAPHFRHSYAHINVKKEKLSSSYMVLYSHMLIDAHQAIAGGCAHTYVHRYTHRQQRGCHCSGTSHGKMNSE